jgi:membrane protein
MQQTVAAVRARVQSALDAVPGIHHTISEFARIELIDRAMAIGAQGLLALIPLLMAFGAFAPHQLSAELLAQVRDVMGVEQSATEPLKEAVDSVGAQPETGLASFLVALLSASSFARGMQRMYARAWHLPKYSGVRAYGISVIWLVGWLVALQLTALLLRAFSGAPLNRILQVSIQLLGNALLWWWTAHLLLGGRVSWQRLVPTALLTSALLVLLGHASGLVMPRYAQASLEQYGPLGVVFAVGTWLVVFGGVIVVAAVLGRIIDDQPWAVPGGAATTGQASGRHGLRAPEGDDEEDEGDDLDDRDDDDERGERGPVEPADQRATTNGRDPLDGREDAVRRGKAGRLDDLGHERLD